MAKLIKKRRDSCYTSRKFTKIRLIIRYNYDTRDIELCRKKSFKRDRVANENVL